MLLSVADVLTPDDVATICETLKRAAFQDGRATAGWSARLVKSNLQADRDPAIEHAREMIEARLRAHPVFALATQPKRIVGPLFSKYTPGGTYGTHIDDAVMDGARTDCAFTLFLAPPDQYDGGELIIETAAGEEAIKLPAGCAVTYPCTALHRVAEVTRGERLAAVGWVRSLIRDAAQRELLFDLETARRRLFDREGKSAEFDLISKSAANLMRMWCDD
jgi:PKHD-type hydroxylase